MTPGMCLPGKLGSTGLPKSHFFSVNCAETTEIVFLKKSLCSVFIKEMDGHRFAIDARRKPSYAIWAILCLNFRNSVVL